MACEANAMVCAWRLDPQIRAHGRIQTQLKPCFPDGRFEYVGTDIFGPLHKTEKGCQYVVVKTDQYTKLENYILTQNKNATVPF